MGTTKPFGVRDNWVLVDSMVDTYCEIAEEAFGSFLFDKGNPVPRQEWPSDSTAYDDQIMWQP